MDAKALTYKSFDLQCLIGVRAYSTRAMIVSSWAWTSEVSIADICAVTVWSSQSTFAWFDNLDVSALQYCLLSCS